MLDTKKVRKLAKSRAIESAYGLWQAVLKAGYKTSESQVRRLWDGTPDPKLSTVDMLCRVLRCEQSDLIAKHGSALVAKNGNSKARRRN